MTDNAGELTPATLRKVFGRFPTGVAAVCAQVGGEQYGMAVSSFTSVSLDPPLASICVARTSTSWPILRKTECLGVSVLAKEHDLICKQLASRSRNRFENVPLWNGSGGALFVEKAAAWFGCLIEREIDAGDHYIVLLRINSLGLTHSARPLVFHDSAFVNLAEPINSLEVRPTI